MKKPKIILIGTSPIMRSHLKAITESGMEPTAVASSNIHSCSHEKFAIENNIKKNYQNWDEMINEEKYDGILIAARTESTIEILEHAIKQNVPILVEKPVSFSSQIIKKLINDSHGQIIVGFNRRFYKTVNEVRNLISKENKPVIASMIAPESSDFRKFFDNAVHGIDLLRYIFGDIKLEHVKKLIVDDLQKGFIATFSNEKNDIIQLIGNWNASDNFSLTIFQDRTKFELKPFEELNIYNGINIIEPTDSIPIRKYQPKLVKRICLDSVDQYIKPGFFQQCNAFSELIRKKTQSCSTASLTDTLKAIEICEKLVGKYDDLL